MGARGKSGRYSVFLGHIGAACIVIGITASGLWKEEAQTLAANGDSLKIAGYTVIYNGSVDIKGDNFGAKKAELKITGADGKEITRLFPEYRTYDINSNNTSEAAIYYSLAGDLYSVIGAGGKDGKTTLRLYFQPMINLIWLGFVLMAMAGITSCLTKHYKPNL